MNAMNGTAHCLACLLAVAGVTLAAHSAVDPLAGFESQPVENVMAVGGLDLAEVWVLTGLPKTAKLQYSATGWGAGLTGNSVHIYLREKEMGRVVEVASGLTGDGECDWDFSGVKARRYEMSHEVAKGTAVDSTLTLRAQFDFTGCVFPQTDEDFQLAVRGVSQPCVIANDAEHPWQVLGGAGAGAAAPTQAAGSVTRLSISAFGEGKLSLEYRLVGDAVTVSVDGGEPEALPAAGDWTEVVLELEGVRRHEVEIACTAAADGAAAIRSVSWVRPVEVVEGASETASFALDLSEVWTVDRIEELSLNYSSVGWDLDEVDGGAAVTLSLVPEDGVGGTQTVQADLMGRGVCAWTPQDVLRKAYWLDHLVMKGGKADADQTLRAVFDFSNCQMAATAPEIRAAAFAPFGQGFEFENDEEHPWQPIDGAGNGIAPPGAASAFTVVVCGAGRFDFGWFLSGGRLAVTVDGKEAADFATPGDWKSDALRLDGRGEHRIVFSVSDGETVAGIKGLHWEQDDGEFSFTEGDGVRMDLREGVRVIVRQDELMPFAYSATNFTGLAANADDPVARVRVVRITGEGEDFGSWTAPENEVAGTERTLRTARDEATVIWRGKCGGIWKAEFEITDGGKSLHKEHAIFDMRRYMKGFQLIVR